MGRWGLRPDIERPRSCSEQETTGFIKSPLDQPDRVGKRVWQLEDVVLLPWACITTKEGWTAHSGYSAPVPDLQHFIESGF